MQKLLSHMRAACQQYEMIKEGENGLLIDRTSDAIYNAIKSLLLDKSKIKTLGETPIFEMLNNSIIMNQIEGLFSTNY